jgi:hypothetical protein
MSGLQAYCKSLCFGAYPLAYGFFTNNAIAVIEFMQNSLQVQNEVQMTGLNDALFTAEIAKAWFCPSYMGGDDAE